MTLYIFDMGGVTAVDTDVFPEIGRRLGIQGRGFEALAGSELEMIMDGAITAADFWARLEGKFGVKVEEDLLAKYFKPSLDPDVAEIIMMLKKRDRVVCGTNTLDSHYTYLEDHGYYDLFDAVYASNRMGVSKPRPEFYRRILAAEDVPPADAVFIDDAPVNVDAAGALGIHSILFRDAAGLRSELEKIGARDKS